VRVSALLTGLWEIGLLYADTGLAQAQNAADPPPAESQAMSPHEMARRMEMDDAAALGKLVVDQFE